MTTRNPTDSLDAVRPPRWADALLRYHLGPDDAETVSGDLLEEYREQLRSLGASSAAILATLLWDGRYRLVTAVLAGFGRAIAEVGAVMIVGGNIDHVTRTMTTTIALETSKGNIALALALGMILLTIALAINMALMGIRRIASYFAYA